MVSTRPKIEVDQFINNNMQPKNHHGEIKFLNIVNLFNSYINSNTYLNWIQCMFSLNFP